jgi:hypothetical protein
MTAMGRQDSDIMYSLVLKMIAMHFVDQNIEMLRFTISTFLDHRLQLTYKPIVQNLSWMSPYMLSHNSRTIALCYLQHYSNAALAGRCHVYCV